MKILGRTVHVQFVSLASEDYGSFSTSSSTIRINPDKSEEEMLSTLVHEVTHAIIWMIYGGADDLTLTEEQVCRVAELVWAHKEEIQKTLANRE